MLLLLIVLPPVFAVIAWGTFKGMRRHRASLRYGAAISVFVVPVGGHDLVPLAYRGPAAAGF
jgi:hypothetical protein